MYYKVLRDVRDDPASLADLDVPSFGAQRCHGTRRPRHWADRRRHARGRRLRTVSGKCILPYRPEQPLSSPQIGVHFDLTSDLIYVPNERQRFRAAVERRLMEATNVFRHNFHGITVRPQGWPQEPGRRTAGPGVTRDGLAPAGVWASAQITAIPVYIPAESSRALAKHTWWYYICIENNLPSMASITLQTRCVGDSPPFLTWAAADWQTSMRPWFRAGRPQEMGDQRGHSRPPAAAGVRRRRRGPDAEHRCGFAHTACPGPATSLALP